MNKNVIKMAAIGVAAVAMSACAQTNTPERPVSKPETNAAVLSQYHWQLQSANHQNKQVIADFYAGKQQPQLQVNFDSGRLGIYGGCNRTGGAYQITGDTIKSGVLVSTQMACPAPLMKQDSAAAAFFSNQAIRYDISQQATPVLTLTASNGDRLQFVGSQTADSKYGNRPETIFLAVSHKTQACVSGVQKHNCLLVKEIRYNEQGLKTYEDKQWSVFHSSIEGFKHRADSDTVLRVKRYTVANPPADAGKYAYVLDMVVEQALVK